MSLGFFPEFKPRLTSARYEPDGCGLLRFADTLDALAVRHGLPLLTSFADTREVPDDFEGDPSDLEDILGPWEDWFSPADGLLVVAGLRNALPQDTSVIGDPADREWVLSELKALEEILRAASSAGSLFRLEVGS